MTTDRKLAGKAAIPARSQGFYRDPETGDKYRSVTTILNQGVPNPALPYWAGNIVAASAIENLPYLVKASRRPAERDEAEHWLSRAHSRKKDERGDVGSAVHDIIEAHVLGLPFPAKHLDNPDMAPFLQHFLSFVDDCNVAFDASEMVVANPDEMYAGTLDYLVRSEKLTELLIARGWLEPDADPAIAFMGDTKTGGEMCTGDGLCVKIRPYEFKVCPGGPLHTIKGVYDTAALQMAAYKAATVAWLRDGRKVPMPPTHDVGIVLHLRPEGYIIHPMRCGPNVFTYFPYARKIAEWATEASHHVIGDPFTAPASTTKASAA